MRNEPFRTRRATLFRSALTILLATCLALTLWSALAAPAFAAEAASPEDETSLVLADERGYQDILEIPMTFYDTRDKEYAWRFPYTDDFFRHPSDRFSVTLARGSMGLAVSAFRQDEKGYVPEYRNFFAAAGFSGIEDFGYDKTPTPTSISGVIASKKIDDMTVIAAVCCGSGYGKEWASNFRIGDGLRHKGFERGAENLERRISQYLKDHRIKGEKKLWLGGHSRAAGIANITAADMIESGWFKDVYAYLTGVPRTTKKPVAYPGIYNICGKSDPVPSVPLASWGFGRYGKDLYTPSQSADSGYPGLAQGASAVAREISGDRFRNDPKLNYEYHLIMSFLGDFFPTTANYTEEFQGILMETLAEQDHDDLSLILSTALSRMETLSKQEERASQFFVQYISTIMDNRSEIDDGSWNPDDSTTDNMMREHRPMTYISWIWADRDPRSIFAGPSVTRRIVLLGEMDLEVYHNGVCVGSVTKNGKLRMLLDRDKPDYKSVPYPFLQRSGTQTVVHLPQDETYTLRVTQGKKKSLAYYDLIYSAYEPQDVADQIYSGAPDPGVYELTVVPGKPLPEMTSLETGEDAGMLRNDYAYSPISEMQMECDSTRYGYLTSGQLINLLLVVLGILVLLPIVCLIIRGRHAAARRKGHPPFSHWYVIVPHLLVILIFTGLTGLFAGYLQSYGKITLTNVSIVALFLFLLSARAFLRNRNPYTAVLSGFFLLATVCVALLAFREPLLTYMYFDMTPFLIAVILCSALAVLAFYVTPETVRKIRKRR